MSKLNNDQEAFIFYANLLDYKLANPKSNEKAYALSKIFEFDPEDGKVRSLVINQVEFCKYVIIGDELFLSMTVLTNHDSFIRESLFIELITFLHGKAFGVIHRKDL